MWSDDYYALYDELQAEIRQLKETIRRREDRIWEMERNHGDEINKPTMKGGQTGHEKHMLEEPVTRRVVYWDDTVIMILTKRGCFRFYGDERIAYYTAHEKKDMKGIDEDGVLELLTSDTFVMHNHNTLNYNKKFHFKNIECDQHLERDLQKNSDDTQHKWSADTKKLIVKAMNEIANPPAMLGRIE